MKILVVYYSRTGRTEQAAKEIAGKLGADIEKIGDKKKREGIWGFVFGGRDAMKKRLTEIEMEIDPGDYDLVIVGTPVWAGNMTPAIRTYLVQTAGRLNKVAFFNTSGGTDPKKIASMMEELSGKKAVAFVGFSERELGDKKLCEGRLDNFVRTVRKS